MPYFRRSIVSSGADSDKRNPVSVSFVHISLNLEYKCRKVFAQRIDLAAIRLSGKGRCCHIEEMLKEYLHSKVGKSRSEANGSKVTLSYGIKVKIGSRSVKKLKLFKKLICSFITNGFPKELFIRNGDLCSSTFLCTLFGIGITDYAVLFSVINSLKSLSGSDRPVNGTGGDSKLFFYIIEELEGVHSVSVHLIDERKDGDMAHNANLKELSCLGLNAL